MADCKFYVVDGNLIYGYFDEMDEAKTFANEAPQRRRVLALWDTGGGEEVSGTLLEVEEQNHE